MGFAFRKDLNHQAYPHGHEAESMSVGEVKYQTQLPGNYQTYPAEADFSDGLFTEKWIGWLDLGEDRLQRVTVLARQPKQRQIPIWEVKTTFSDPDHREVDIELKWRTKEMRPDQFAQYLLRLHQKIIDYYIYLQGVDYVKEAELQLKDHLH